MNEKNLTSSVIQHFAQHLRQEEKSVATIEKYLRDVTAFFKYAGQKKITKELVVAFKQYLADMKYAARSINSMLASLNSLLNFLGLSDCRAKSVRLQKQTFCAEAKELNKSEYLRLLEAAKGQSQLRLMMESICATGIRVSELLSCIIMTCSAPASLSFMMETEKRTVMLPKNTDNMTVLFLCTLLKVGGDKRDRTADLLNAIQALSQLSYTPILVTIHIKLTETRDTKLTYAGFKSDSRLKRLPPG